MIDRVNLNLYRASHRLYRDLLDCKSNNDLYKYYFGQMGSRSHVIKLIVQKRKNIKYPFNVKNNKVHYLEEQASLIASGWKKIPYCPPWLIKEFPPLIQF